MWVERFAAYQGTNELRSQGEGQINAFLDSLALHEQLSASSQRQALNALVFLFRDVFERKSGDFSDYRRQVKGFELCGENIGGGFLAEEHQELAGGVVMQTPLSSL